MTLREVLRLRGALVRASILIDSELRDGRIGSARRQTLTQYREDVDAAMRIANAIQPDLTPAERQRIDELVAMSKANNELMGAKR